MIHAKSLNERTALYKALRKRLDGISKDALKDDRSLDIGSFRTAMDRLVADAEYHAGLSEANGHLGSEALSREYDTLELVIKAL